jgi:hypothetical protein
MSGTSWYVSALLILINLGTIISFIKYSTMLFGRSEPVGSIAHAGAGAGGVSVEVTAGGASAEGEAVEENEEDEEGEVTEEDEAAEEDEEDEDSEASESGHGGHIGHIGHSGQIGHGEHAGHGGHGGVERVSVFKQAAILILGALCFLGGIFGEEFITFLFNVQVSVDAAGYIEKTAFFAASLVVGYLIFRYFVKRTKLFERIRDIDFGFRGICISMGGFFAVLLVVVGFL